LDQIAQYYEGYDEESRLIKDNSHKVEFITTIHTLDDKIKKGARILEVGARTGRYSFYYLDEGHAVTALDIVPKNVEIMKEKLKQSMQGIYPNLIQILLTLFYV